MLFKNEDKKYLARLDTQGVFNNTTKTALPQTVFADAVRKHFKGQNSRTPKALLIGFDGARADAMHLLCESKEEKVTGVLFNSAYSAVQALRAEGGLYLSYAGGEPNMPQETSTAQGWAAILTGVWGTENGVLRHVPMKTACPTVLRELAMQGKKAAFLAEWQDHFTITYRDEIAIAEREKLPLVFQKYADDRALEFAFSEQIANGTDCIFGIFEAPDYNGHSTGFSLENPRYTAGVCRLDNIAYRLMEAVKTRSTYREEDWLIMITSDHGGHGLRHGTQKQFDRMTFIASNKPIAEK